MQSDGYRIFGMTGNVTIVDTDCFLTPLGSLVSPSRQRANTRVFMLLTDDGDPFKAMFNNRRRDGIGDEMASMCR